MLTNRTRWSVWAAAPLLAVCAIPAFCAPGASWTPGKADPEFVQRSIEYARKATRAMCGPSCDANAVRSILEREPKVDVQGRTLMLHWGGDLFTFRLGAEKPCSVAIHGPAKPGRPIDLQTARKAALRAFVAITGRRDGRIMEGTTENLASSSGEYRFEIARVVAGIRCSGRSTIAIGGNTGLPVEARIAEDPKIRPTDQPVVGLPRVTRDLHANVARLNAFPREHWGDVELVWAVPDFGKWPNEMGPEHIAAAAAGESMPLYHVAIFDADTWIPEIRCSRLVGDAWVDAVSGKTIAMRFGDITPVLERMPREPLKVEPILPVWPAPGADVAVLGSRAAVAGAAIEACEAVKAPAEGVLVTITSGRDAWNVRFDRKSGLIWMDAGGKRAYGRPNEPLLKALKQVKPTKLTPFGGKKLAKAS